MLQKILIYKLERLDIDIEKLTIGAIIGSAFLYDFKEYSNQEEFNKDKQKHFSIVTKYFEGYKYGFLIRNARLFKKSIPYRGKLRFFKVYKSIKF